MPVMNVRGDQHLNFTPEEAAAWLGDVPVRYHTPRADDNDDAIVGVFGVMVLGVILTFIWAAFSGSTQRPVASNASGTSIQRRDAVAQATPTADAPRQEAASEIVSSPVATAEYRSAPVAYMPTGWFYGRMQGALPLRNNEGRSIGAVPDGGMFFATTAESASQIIVASDGSYWGYAVLTPPKNPPSIPVTPAFENAARIIKGIEAFGITNALYMYNRQPPEEAYLPDGWSMGAVAQDQPLADRINGARIGTIKTGTWLLYQIANANDWRLVVSADGSFYGYACIRSLQRVPDRTPMRPECRGGVALIHRLQQAGGQGRVELRQALAENFPTQLPDEGAEQ